jgi:hypothetical protein
MEKKIQNDDEDYFLKPNNPRELLLQEHLTPFLMQYIQQLKTTIEILVDSSVVELLAGLRVSLDDVSKLSDDDLLVFKELMIKKKVSKFHRGCGEVMDSIFDILIDIISKRVLIEIPSIKLDLVVSKIKLIAIPQGIIPEPI